MFAQQGQLLGNGGVSILVAADSVAEDRQRPPLIDDRTQSGVEQLRTLRYVGYAELSITVAPRGARLKCLLLWFKGTNAQVRGFCGSST